MLTSSFSDQGQTKIKIAAQRYLEYGTFELCIIECCIMRLFIVFKVFIIHIWCYLFNVKSWLGHIFVCRILLVMF